MKKVLVVACICLCWCSGFVSAQSDTTSLTFTGDAMLGRGIAKEIHTKGRANFFNTYKRYFENSDVGIVNFECSIASPYPPIKKRFNFACEREDLEYMRKIGITHLNLANNHSIDFGSCGLKETIDQITQHDLSSIGVGVDSSQLFSPTLIYDKGNSIALFASVLLNIEKYADTNCPVFIYHDKRYTLHNAIREFKFNNPDAVIIILLHWGIEERAEPSVAQEVYARRLIDSGADMIIGCGSHTLQKVQTYKDKNIYYSLGDFIFDRFKDQGGVLTIKVQKSRIIDAKLTDISHDNSR